MAITGSDLGSWPWNRTVPSAQPGLPGPGDYLPALDGVRVAAALAVTVSLVGAVSGYTLTGSPEAAAVSRCDVGIALFFCLSGFLLFRPWAAAALGVGQPPRLTAYLSRRAVRILPAYWAVVIVALIVVDRQHARSGSAWAPYVLLFQDYDRHPWWTGTGAPGLEQLWTVPVQASFYLLLPVLAGLLSWGARLGTPSRAAVALRLLVTITVLALASCALTALEYLPPAGCGWARPGPRCSHGSRRGWALPLFRPGHTPTTRRTDGPRSSAARLRRVPGLVWASRAAPS